MWLLAALYSSLKSVNQYRGSNMPFVWNNTEPSPGQNISDGQATILNNFNFLADGTGNTSPTGYYKFPNNLIINWGKLTPGNPPGTGWSTSGSDHISPQQFFALPFVSPPFSIVLSVQVGDTQSKRFVIYDNAPGAAPTKTSFYVGASTLTFDFIYWMAIGV